MIDARIEIAVNDRSDGGASALWYLLSAFAVISYTGNSIYVIFAATGSWIGAYFSVRWLDRADSKLTPGGPAALGNPPV